MNQKTISTRSVDVTVIGGGPLALSTSISLVRKGKRVALIPSFGIETHAAGLPKEIKRPLWLPSSSALLANLSAESSLYWHGLQSQMGKEGQQLLHSCPTLDLFLSQDFESISEETITRIKESSASASIKVGSLKGQDLTSVFPLFRPDGLTGLVQPSGGGVLDFKVASQYLSSTALRLGVKLKENSRLSGWKDMGDYFIVNASSSFLLDKDEIVAYETEQIILAPDEDGWPAECFSLFQLDLSKSIRVVERIRGGVEAGSDLTKLPLTRFYCGSDSWSFAVYPRLSSESSVKISSPPSILDPNLTIEPWTYDVKDSNTDLPQDHRLNASKFIRSISDRPENPHASSSLCISTPDGLPIVGFHPSFQSGRILVACSSSANSTSGIESLGDGFLLSPLMGRISADLLTGSALQDVSPDKIDLNRPSLVGAGKESSNDVKKSTVKGVIDTFTELWTLQRGLNKRRSSEQIEEDEEVAEEKRKAEKAA